jgi:hypothetical protein
LEDIMDNIDEATGDTPNPIDRLVERWWEDHFPGSPVARDTEAWNVAHAAKETLKQLLRKVQSLPQAEIGEKDSQGSM